MQSSITPDFERIARESTVEEIVAMLEVLMDAEAYEICAILKAELERRKQEGG